MEHIVERAARSAVWRKLEVYFPMTSVKRPEQVKRQYFEDLRWQRQIARAVEKRPETAPGTPRPTRVERWTEAARAHTGDMWTFENMCMAEVPRGERGAARDKAIAECARAWRAAGR